MGSYRYPMKLELRTIGPGIFESPPISFQRQVLSIFLLNLVSTLPTISNYRKAIDSYFVFDGSGSWYFVLQVGLTLNLFHFAKVVFLAFTL